jgi:hypothetical protein
MEIFIMNDKYTNNSIKTIKGKIILYKSINKKILLSIVLNEIFYAFIISKESRKLRIAFTILEKVESLNGMIEECKKIGKIVIIWLSILIAFLEIRVYNEKIQ